MKENGKRWKSIGIGCLSGLINGLLGSGGGTILVPCMERILHVEEHKSHATAIAVIAPLCVFSAVLYGTAQVPDWKILLQVSLGGTVGGLLGAKLLSRLSGKLLHIVFGISMMIAGVRMVFG